MTLQELLQIYRQRYEVLAEIDLDHWHELESSQKVPWLKDIVNSVHRSIFNNNQRIIFTLTQGEHYEKQDSVQGLIVKNLQKILNGVDISNYFVVLLINDKKNLENYIHNSKMNSIDTVPLTIDLFDDPPCPSTKKVYNQSIIQYDYNSPLPVTISLNDLEDRHSHLLTDSKTFCIYPWIHIHTDPNGKAFPCCFFDSNTESLGSVKKNSLKELWNGDRMKQLRVKMLNDTPDSGCIKCYESEKSGFFSGRRSANKHYGHHIRKVDNTGPDGHLEEFKMVHWDIRFSNLCNLRCRSCGHLFSSQWYQDQAKLEGPEWAAKHQVLNFSGRTPTDMWEQLLPHLDYVEQIYFAGGEPLIMDEHYMILEELVRQEKFNIRLLYNTNFTEVKLKKRLVFDYWKKFDSVAVGASLDAMGACGEYMRKGTKWHDIIENRQRMLEICPQVNFYISSTLSIMNAWHLPDFHRDWVDRGLIRHQDFDVHALQQPNYYRIDIAPMKYKQQLRDKYEKHLAWLRPYDHLCRATNAFESAINFMMATDNTQLIDTFWHQTNKLDTIRNENMLRVIPELEALK